MKPSKRLQKIYDEYDVRIKQTNDITVLNALVISQNLELFTEIGNILDELTLNK